MIKQRDEKKRAVNIIWNASEDYSYQPESRVYDEDGKADIYQNYIIGAVYKYYDYKILKSFFNYLRTDSDHEFYERLMWIGLENSTYHKGKKERPVLKKLRMDYSKKVLNGEMPSSERSLLNEIEKAHYKRVLGENPNVEERLLKILDKLEFDENMDTKQIVLRMNEIIKKYFKFSMGSYESSLDEYAGKKKSDEAVSTKEKKEEKTEKSEDSGYSPRQDLTSESAETARNFYFEKNENNKDANLNLHKLTVKRANTDRNYMKKYYGVSILPEHKISALEHILCTGNHKRARLHITRGEFDESLNDAEAVYNKKTANEQKESNIDFYYENYARNNNSILNLTNKIRNTMLVNFDTSVVKSKYGRMDANRIWRNIYVNDSRIFNKDLKNEIGNITVDILLDCSASQCERQEIIAAQGYIIAESLTRCNIPSKVYSFCSLRGYTIINIFRDYEETDKNNRIFNYRASGCNRDGLAIRTALHMMGNTHSENKILIVLSDCKPNDIETNPGTGIIPEQTEYSGVKGVNDTAYEVKRGIVNGNTIMCVFTGEDEDLPSAKKIYGHNFVRINNLERFADIVGVLLQNCLKNL